jgi:hypothetical protein
MNVFIFSPVVTDVTPTRAAHNEFCVAMVLAGLALPLEIVAQTTPQKFLLYCYGADSIDITAITHPNDDIWMLRGARNEEGIEAVKTADLKLEASGVFSGPIGRDFCVVQMRTGKVDPGYNLEQVYGMHRRLVLQFVFACLSQEKSALQRLATNPANISFGKTNPARAGDLDVYADVISMIPVLRASASAADKTSKSVSYRLPIGRQEVVLKLVKKERAWLVDSSAPIKMPMEFFYEEGPDRKVFSP